MKRGINIAAALLEPILVFVAGAWLFRLAFRSVPTENLFSQWTPLCRVVVILAIAFITDKLLRKRNFGDWGLTGGKITKQTFKDSLFLLITGGIIPLGLTWMFPSVLGADKDLQAAGILIPVMSQEIFLLGYARRRFSDALTQPFVLGLIVTLFLAAHLNHTAREPVGLLFLLAMGCQGYVWSRFMFMKGSLIPLMFAHMALLLLYHVPGVGFIVLLLAALHPSYRTWLGAILPLYPTGRMR